MASRAAGRKSNASGCANAQDLRPFFVGFTRPPGLGGLAAAIQAGIFTRATWRTQRRGGRRSMLAQHSLGSSGGKQILSTLGTAVRLHPCGDHLEAEITGTMKSTIEHR